MDSLFLLWIFLIVPFWLFFKVFTYIIEDEVLIFFALLWPLTVLLLITWALLWTLGFIYSFILDRIFK